MEKKIDPATVKKIIDVTIKILTLIGGFLAGMGTASAATILFNL